ncbi:DUF4394 domain-containing protein [Sphingomonas profundi]|uniref:DUF4394 domain-containing protein n=1 Tax=Alterirhizorhabdus profundi TaxID=2681549 RepID=UPI0018D02A4F|nr:DUF4394 domain-containing protein [Sphingomonas profundi]
MLSASAYTIAGAGAAQAVTLQAVRGGTTLVTLDSATPATATNTVTITGLGSGQTIAGIDYRPSPLATSANASRRLLYAISNTGQLYAVNGTTGTAVAVGATPAVNLALVGNPAVGIDFNPTVDRIRLVTTNRTDYRLVPDTGALAATDGNLTYAGTDPNAGAVPVVSGAAYTNNVPGATTTTLYVIDTRGGTAAARLATQGQGAVSPNSGTLFTVGSTGVTTNNNVGFDIATNGTAYATLTNPTTGVTSLYTINLATGVATSVGALAGNTTYGGLAATVLAPFQSMGATANQQAAGAALDRFTIATGGLLAPSVAGLFNGIDSLTGNPGAQAAALQQLTPAAYSLLPDIALNAIEVQETTVLRYTRDLRGNATMPDGSVATLDEAGKIGAWVSGGSRFGRYKGDVDRYGADTDEYHFLGGADFRLNPKIAFGGFGGYSKVNGNTAPFGRGKADLRSFFGGAYGTAAVGPLYIDAWGSYTDLDFALERSISIGNYGTTLTARASKGRVWTGGAATGLSFQLGNFEVEPFGAVRYSDIRIRGFTEVGGGAGGLTIGDFDRVSLRTNAGARVGTKFEVMGAIVRPQLRGGWYHEFRDQARVITAAFNTPGIANPFSFTTTPLSGDYFNAGAALNISGNGPVSMVADFDSQFDDDREYYTMTIGARLAF